MQQVELLLTLHQTTQEHLTQAQHLLHASQQRFDRLLEAPQQSSPPQASTQASPPPGDRGLIRRQILALLANHPEGLTPAQIRDHLQTEKPLNDTLQGMLRGGLVQRVAGRYTVREPLCSVTHMPGLEACERDSTRHRGPSLTAHFQGGMSQIDSTLRFPCVSLRNLRRKV